ncbi:MAG: nucleoside-diphosphate kinase [Clostridia bacterium]
MEKSCVLIKPGFKHLEKEIIKWLEGVGGKIIKRKEFYLTHEQLKKHYAHLYNESFYPELEKYMMSDKVVGMVVEGENIIAEIRRILGPTKNAPKGTIRGEYAINGRENVLHASDCLETAEQEIKRFFG